MADLKISQLNSIVTVVPATDVLPVVQGGTTLKITPNQILGSGGTATLASATITGALTANGGIAMANATSLTFGGLLTIYSDTAAGLFIRGRTVTGTTFQTQDGTQPLLNISNSGIFTFSDGAGGTRMTLNSTGLGIGVGPSYNIDVLAATLPTIAVRATSAGASNARFYLECAGTNSGHITYNRSLQALQLGANGGTTAQVTLDSAGNLGIGVTPSAAKLEIGGGDGTQFYIRSTGTNPARIRGFTNATEAGLIGFLNGGGIYFDVSGEKVRIDASGNFIPILTLTPPTLATNSQMVFNLTSNTNLRISVRGTDGTTRTANITLA